MNYFKLPDAFRDRHAGRPGLLVCRSPWVDDDLTASDCAFRDDTIRVGVNHSILKYPLDYCAGGDPKFWELVKPRQFPETEFLTHDIESGNQARKNVTVVRCLIQRSTVSSIFALWFCWYLGLDPIRVCGAHFKVKNRGENPAQIYGDVPAERMFPDRLSRKKYLMGYMPRLPQQAKDFARMVNSIREQGTRVDWPGEKCATGAIEKAGQEFPTNQRFDKTLIEPDHQAAYGSQGLVSKM